MGCQEGRKRLFPAGNADDGLHRKLGVELRRRADHRERGVALRVREQRFEHRAVLVARGGEREVDDRRAADRNALVFQGGDERIVRRERGDAQRAKAVDDAGCTLVGLTGRNDSQKEATLGNLAKVGYTGFTAQNFYTKWTGQGASQQPPYVVCATAKCTTIEYKSQTRAHVESAAGGGYDIVANFGDQFSDLKGGYADRTFKLPNPNYYLP